MPDYTFRNFCEKGHNRENVLSSILLNQNVYLKPTTLKMHNVVTFSIQNFLTYFNFMLCTQCRRKRRCYRPQYCSLCYQPGHSIRVQLLLCIIILFLQVWQLHLQGGRLLPQVCRQLHQAYEQFLQVWQLYLQRGRLFPQVCRQLHQLCTGNFFNRGSCIIKGASYSVSFLMCADSFIQCTC